MEKKKFEHLLTTFEDLQMIRPFFDGKAHLVTEYDNRCFADTKIWMHYKTFSKGESCIRLKVQ